MRDFYAEGLRRWRIAVAAVPLAVLCVLLAATWRIEGAWSPREDSGEPVRLAVIMLPFVALEAMRALRERWIMRLGADWPVAQATITRSEVSDDRGGLVEIEFAFEAGGRSRVGRHLEYLDLTDPKPQEVAARFPVGAKVLVHVNPADPALAMFPPSGRSLRNHVGVALAVVGLLAAILAAYRWA